LESGEKRNIQMEEIQKVAVLGAGAMGAYFASRFFETPFFKTSLVAKGERYDRLKTTGIVVNGKQYNIPVINPETATEPVDLLIVALKHHHLAEAVHGLEKIVGESTTIISVMNGLESEEYIGAIYGMDKMLYTISAGIDALRVGNQTNYTSPGTHTFGEARNETISPRVKKVQAAFEKAGINYKTPVDMIRMMWWKFMVNVGVNQASAVTRMRFGVFQTNKDAQALMEALMREVVTLANLEGVNLTEQDIADWYPVMNQLSPQGKTSMLQDIDACQKTEVEVFSGRVIALGKKHNIPTPVNQTIFQIIRVLEQSYIC
jgi:2-dehydropantoate 2-reductase